MTVLFSRSGKGKNGDHLKTGDSPRLGDEALKIAIAADAFLEAVRQSSPDMDKENLPKSKELLKTLCPTATREEKALKEKQDKRP